MDVDAELGRALPLVARSASEPDRVMYSRDLWPRHHIAVRAGDVAPRRPALVVWPSSTEEVADVVAWCAREGVPLVPFGAGSGVCGGILPDERTVVLDLKKLSRWRDIDRDGPSLDVEAGALGIRLEEDLEARGYTTGHFPSSILCSTVGGWIAARGAGQCSGRYGKIEDMVASIECVTGRGDVVRFHRRVNGPDLTPLLIGSEGVLGVVTSARLRLHPTPSTRAFRGLSFATLETGWSALREMFQAGLRPAVARLYDPFDSLLARRGGVRSKRAGRDRAARDPSHGERARPGSGARVLRSLLRAPKLVNALAGGMSSGFGERCLLVLVFEGPLEEAGADLARAMEIGERYRARDLGEQPARDWYAHRYSVSYRQAPTFMAGAFSDTMEVAATWTRLGAVYRAVRDALSAHVFVMAHLSHAYPDGCSIYFTFAGARPTYASALATYDAAWRDALDAAVAAGATLSHHHGVGRNKAPKLGAELGLGISVVQALRNAFDPAAILNPGNLLPRDRVAIRAAPAAPSSVEIDATTQLAHAPGAARLSDLERAASEHGLSLALGSDAPPLETATLAEWLATGARGAPDPWLDPVDHLVAGFSATLRSGAVLDVHAAPRRAVGPDLFALFLGMRGQVGEIRSAHVRLRGPNAARALTTGLDRNPAIFAAEAEWIDRVARATACVDGA